MNIREYISSGIIESCVLGLASDEERHEFEQYCIQYPELADAREKFEESVEKLTQQNAVVPPFDLRSKILASINSENTELNRATESKVVGVKNWWKYAVAASILLMVASLVWNLSLINKNESLKSDYAKLDSNYNRAVAKLGDMEKDMHVIQQNPNIRMAAMKGMPEMPAASATVYWDTTSKNVYLLIHNLPQPPSDKQYQLWALLNGLPVDVGMIENDYLISQKKLLLRFENVQGAQAFAVTLEAKGGSPKPKGKMYVLGNL